MLLFGFQSHPVSRYSPTSFENDIACHFSCFLSLKNDDVELAVAAVYTYMLKHPDDKASKDNIEFYQKLPGVTADAFKNLESMDHQVCKLSSSLNTKVTLKKTCTHS